MRYLLLFLIFNQVNAQTFYTWQPWEVDTITAAWALQRYVYPKASFQALTKGSPISPSQGIDIPNAPYQRSARFTTLDTVIQKHSLKNHCVKTIQPLVKVIELASWRVSEQPEIEEFALQIRLRLQHQSLETVFVYLDNYCQKEKK